MKGQLKLERGKLHPRGMREGEKGEVCCQCIGKSQMASSCRQRMLLPQLEAYGSGRAKHEGSPQASMGTGPSAVNALASLSLTLMGSSCRQQMLLPLLETYAS